MYVLKLKNIKFLNFSNKMYKERSRFSHLDMSSSTMSSNPSRQTSRISMSKISLTINSKISLLTSSKETYYYK